MDKCKTMYWVCPLNAKGKADDKHCKTVKKCGGEHAKWKKAGDGFEHCEGDEEDGKHLHNKHCKTVKKCGGEHAKWKKAGDGFEHCEGDEEDGKHHHKKHHHKKHHKKHHGILGDDDEDGGKHPK